MKEHQHFRYSTSVIAFPILFVLVIWFVFWFEVRFGYKFSKFGVYPQTLSGLKGVILSPFIHGDIQHLYHNTIPLFVLSTALFYFYKPIAWKVMFFGILVSGFLTWCIGRPSYHIGASGLIYVLVSFTFFKGVFAKHFRLIALSLLVVFLYGSMIWHTLPIEEGISWEGHLSGLITGLVFAVLFKNKIAKPKKYKWEQDDFNEEEDPFLKHFDENGNFIESKETEELQDDNVMIHYTFKKKEE
ncbi:rhomboid family intramembrane serine protease [Hyunsoonleella pacifica]|uniref:Rhomboid family intramembrane serine protease n=1 Tax=Hyunsoonleella pacifica TaxID=1080224 RepID=A0A4Q9FIV5_9FLAO|nr:rhomboid family intramembrane serine protease [Hyunsoonleella pacifica]TBN12427.1 rhomboid family intramembrane serine protease [Hyunsoonleella pacifica]GGD29639.1 rhomboid family intramembrane serine protease [Hyunsoonleella pacifica]